MNKQLAVQETVPVRATRRVGRQPKLTVEALRVIREKHKERKSYADIAIELHNSGLSVSRWTIRRAVLGLPPYEREDSTEVRSQ